MMKGFLIVQEQEVNFLIIIQMIIILDYKIVVKLNNIYLNINKFKVLTF